MRRTPAICVCVCVALGVTAGSASASGRPDRPDRTVHAGVETPDLYDDAAGGDADADDPAIWIHPWRRDRSLVLGAAKNGGLRVYDLAGREVQAIATPPAPAEGAESGRFNNVDVLTGFRLGGAAVDLAVVTDRGRDQLRIYRIDPTAAAAGRPALVDVTVADAPLLFSRDQAEVADQATGYGLATYADGGRGYAVVSRRHRTRLGVFALVEQAGRVGYRRTDQLDLPATFALPGGATWTPCAEPGEEPQVEGMVVDAAAGVLYAGQEDVGLWRIGLRLRAGRFGAERHIVERVAEFGAPATYDPETEECVPGVNPGLGGRIRADVEGLTLYDTGRGRGHLLVSSQGDNRFYVYDRRTNAPVTSFVVGDGPRTDGAQHSDGTAATSVSLPGHPAGLLVVHDGENTPTASDGDGEPRANTNFKYVDWRALHLR